ncbi:MAG: LacI family DNA-binding transcriptional regulator [bacterium]
MIYGSKRAKHLTIRDIARLAEVSRSTVSLAINDSPRINAKTKHHVLEIIKKVGYHPNVMARALVEKKSRVISILVPQIDHVFSDFYFSETVSGVLDVGYKQNYRVMLEVATQDFIAKRVYLKLFQEQRIDGMLLVGTLTTDSYIHDLRSAGYPIVLVNSEMEGVSSVVADNVKGTRDAVKYLCQKGHRKFGYIKGLDITTTGLQRDEGFQKAVRELNVEFRQEWIGYGNFSERSGYEAMCAILKSKRHPTAVFATNDMMAIGAIKACHELGLNVPGDIAIIGGDDVLLASYFKPTITTIKQSMYDLGSLATTMLLQIIDHKITPPARRVIQTELIVRESCGGLLQEVR